MLLVQSLNKYMSSKTKQKMMDEWFVNEVESMKNLFFFLVPYNLEQVLGSLWVYKITSFDHEYGTIDFTDFKRKYFFFSIEVNVLTF